MFFGCRAGDERPNFEHGTCTAIQIKSSALCSRTRVRKTAKIRPAINMLRADAGMCCTRQQVLAAHDASKPPLGRSSGLGRKIDATTASDASIRVQSRPRACAARFVSSAAAHATCATTQSTHRHARTHARASRYKRFSEQARFYPYDVQSWPFALACFKPTTIAQHRRCAPVPSARATRACALCASRPRSK